MDKGDIVSSIIAAVSAVIAVTSLIVTVVFARRQTRMQATLTAIEQERRREEVEARSRASVRVAAEGDRRRAQLVLSNSGPGTARDLRLITMEPSGP